MKQKKLIFNFVVNRNWKKLTDSRKRAKILADNRKSYHPIETLWAELAILPRRDDTQERHRLEDQTDYPYLIMGNERSMKLTRIVKIRVNFVER